MTKFIKGAGKGGNSSGRFPGGQYPPTEADDSLSSVQYASVLDLLSEGPVEGIENGVKGIYLDNTPVQAADGSNNFQGYSVTTRNGTQDQAYISDLTGTESEQAVNTAVVKSTPVVRQITNTNVDRVRVTLQVPSLQVAETDGDIVGHAVQIKIHLQYNGGGYTAVVDNTISGKTSDPYQRDYLITLDGAFPVDLKVERVSPDDADSRHQSQTTWTSYTEIIDEKLRYPNSALAHLRFDSKSFNSIPVRKYLLRGLKIKLPSNASVDTTTHLGRVTYTGLWDGTFGAATWCNDPAWCLWDLITSTRYGANIPESSLDKWDFYSISQYCNELVSNGKGGQEPRFSCNININGRDEVYNVINEMTNIFRGMSYYAAGSLVLLQDKPVDSQYLLGPSNVVDGIFTYSGTSQKARHTTATVAWQDYQTLGEVQFEYVENADAVSKYGIINKDIRALGCYSQGQANRLGRWTLETEQNLTETVTFSVSVDSGITLRPGMVIDVADPLRGGQRRSGRIKSATTSSVVIDAVGDLNVNLSNSPKISVIMPNGLIETKTITGITGTTVNISGTFSEAPNANNLWLIQTSDILPQQFRVITVSGEQDGISSVTALAYNSSIYNAIENNLSVVQRDISNLGDPPDPVTNITGSEFLYEEGSSVLVGFDLSWTSPVKRVQIFNIKYRLNDDNWISVETTSPSLNIRNLRPGTLKVAIEAIGQLGKASRVATANFTLAGKTAVPSNISNLELETIGDNSARLAWDQTGDLDVKSGGKVHIRHSNKTDGTANWSDSVEVTTVSGAAGSVVIPLLPGEVMVKFEDASGSFSALETSTIVDPPDPVDNLIILDRREDQDNPPFQGAKVNTFYSGEWDALTLVGDSNFDLIADVDIEPNFDFLGSIQPSGTYTFANPFDLGVKFPITLEKKFVTRGFFPDDLIDHRTTLMDTWTTFDGDVVNNVNAILEVRTTDGDPTDASATWGDWNEFQKGIYQGRGYQFRSTLTSTNVDENILVDELGYTASMTRRTEQSNGVVASGAATKTVPFTHKFFTGTSSLGGSTTAYLPSVGINAYNMVSGDYIDMGTVTGSNFQITFKNSSGASVDRNFTWTAVGFGKGI